MDEVVDELVDEPLVRAPSCGHHVAAWLIQRPARMRRYAESHTYTHFGGTDFHRRKTVALTRPARSSRGPRRCPGTVQITIARPSAVNLNALHVLLPDGTLRSLGDTTPEEIFRAIWCPSGASPVRNGASAPGTS